MRTQQAPFTYVHPADHILDRSPVTHKMQQTPVYTFIQQALFAYAHPTGNIYRCTQSRFHSNLCTQQVPFTFFVIPVHTSIQGKPRLHMHMQQVPFTHANSVIHVAAFVNMQAMFTDAHSERPICTQHDHTAGTKCAHSRYQLNMHLQRLPFYTCKFSNPLALPCTAGLLFTYKFTHNLKG